MSDTVERAFGDRMRVWSGTGDAPAIQIVAVATTDNDARSGCSYALR